MKTVCLITPPSAFLLDERVLITLGILRVAACLEMAGYRVDHLDLSGVGDYESVARAYAASSRPLAYGVTATTPQMPAVTRVARALRESAPGARLILGGPHPTLVNAARRRESRESKPGRATRAMRGLLADFDVVVAGDGEDAVFEALRPAASGLIDADDPKGGLFLTNKRLEELPLPARHLVDVSSYQFSIEGAPALSMIAQLGCPFSRARSAGAASRPCSGGCGRAARRAWSGRSGTFTRPTASRGSCSMTTN